MRTPRASLPHISVSIPGLEENNMNTPADRQPVVLITGAARRLGAALARHFASHAWRVAIHCRHSLPEAQALFAELGGIAKGHLLLRGDLLDEQFTASMLPQVLAEAGHLDCLINNASEYHRRPLQDISRAEMQADYAINFTVPFFLMQSFRRLCRTGNIINILDQSICKADPGGGAYALAKKSLRDATEACALEWAPGIRVNAIAPGLVLPPPNVPMEKMQRLLQNVPMRAAVDLADLCRACLFLAETYSLTGQIIYADGGLHLPNGDLGEKTAAR